MQAEVETRKHRLSVTDFQRMAEVGILGEGDRLELIEGEIIHMAPIGSRHAAVVDQLAQLLHKAVGDAAILRVQGPLQLGEHSQPQPDLALLRYRRDFYAQAHPGPEDTLLLIEVADYSLAYDRQIKIPLYARHLIPEAWLINLQQDRLEIYQSPSSEGYERILRPSSPGTAPLPELATELDLGWLFG